MRIRAWLTKKELGKKRIERLLLFIVWRVVSFVKSELYSGPLALLRTWYSSSSVRSTEEREFETISIAMLAGTKTVRSLVSFRYFASLVLFGAE